jgi:tetratricopeptide (TPR) repeat protein
MLMHINREFGNYYYDLKEYNTALQILNQSRLDAIKYFGSKHSTVAHILNDIGNNYAATKNWDKAYEKYRESLELFKQLNATEDESQASLYNNIGNYYKFNGDTPKAIENYQKALRISKRQNGADHISTAACYNNLGRSYRGIDKKIADLNTKKALIVYFKHHEKNHPVITDALDNILWLRWMERLLKVFIVFRFLGIFRIIPLIMYKPIFIIESWVYRKNLIKRLYGNTEVAAVKK